MADKEEKKKGSDEKKKTEGQPNKSGKTGIFTWIIMAAIILTLTGSGFVVGRIFAGSTPAKETEATAQQTIKEKSPVASAEETKDLWYYPMDPIVANLNEPGAMRYVRAAITLQVSGAWPKEDGEKSLKDQEPRLRSWLAIYLASLTTEDATGDKNLRHIQMQILDSFNEILFPNQKPYIKQVLFKEGLAIQ